MEKRMKMQKMLSMNKNMEVVGATEMLAMNDTASERGQRLAHFSCKGEGGSKRKLIPEVHELDCEFENMDDAIIEGSRCSDTNAEVCNKKPRLTELLNKKANISPEPAKQEEACGPDSMSVSNNPNEITVIQSQHKQLVGLLKKASQQSHDQMDTRKQDDSVDSDSSPGNVNINGHRQASQEIKNLPEEDKMDDFHNTNTNTVTVSTVGKHSKKKGKASSVDNNSRLERIVEESVATRGQLIMDDGSRGRSPQTFDLDHEQKWQQQLLTMMKEQWGRGQGAGLVGGSERYLSSSESKHLHELSGAGNGCDSGVKESVLTPGKNKYSTTDRNECDTSNRDAINLSSQEPVESPMENKSQSATNGDSNSIVKQMLQMHTRDWSSRHQVPSQDTWPRPRAGSLSSSHLISMLRGHRKKEEDTEQMRMRSASVSSPHLVSILSGKTKLDSRALKVPVPYCRAGSHTAQVSPKCASVGSSATHKDVLQKEKSSKPPADTDQGRMRSGSLTSSHLISMLQDKPKLFDNTDATRMRSATFSVHHLSLNTQDSLPSKARSRKGKSSHMLQGKQGKTALLQKCLNSLPSSSRGSEGDILPLDSSIENKAEGDDNMTSSKNMYKEELGTFSGTKDDSETPRGQRKRYRSGSFSYSSETKDQANRMSETFTRERANTVSASLHASSHSILKRLLRRHAMSASVANNFEERSDNVEPFSALAPKSSRLSGNAKDRQQERVDADSADDADNKQPVKCVKNFYHANDRHDDENSDSNEIENGICLPFVPLNKMKSPSDCTNNFEEGSEGIR